MSQKTQWPEDVADWPKTASVVQGGVVSSQAHGKARQVTVEQLAKLQERCDELQKQRDMLLDVLRKTADDLAYVAYNLDGSKLDDLEAGLSESTCPSDTALIAERNCREAISRAEGGAA